MDDPHTLVGKIFGGYLTTSTEVIASMKKEGKSALGVWVKGLQGSGVKVLPTEKLRASEPHARLIDVLNALALRPRKPPIQILDKAKQMRRSYAEYVKEHGLQCRPLVKHAVLALDKQDAKDVQKKNSRIAQASFAYTQIFGRIVASSVETKMRWSLLYRPCLNDECQASATTRAAAWRRRRPDHTARDVV